MTGGRLISTAFPHEIQVLVQSHVNGFNAHNAELFISVFDDTAVIIDGIAPYRWLTPNAPARWLADVGKWRDAFDATYEHLAYEVGFCAMEGSPGYAVLSANVTLTLKGENVVRTGTLAYRCAKQRETWKIEA